MLRRWSRHSTPRTRRSLRFATPNSPIEIVGWSVSVACRLRDDDRRHARGDQDGGAARAIRSAFFPGAGRVPDARCAGSRRLAPGERIAGPAIIESSFTTVVVNPGAVAERRQSGSLSVDPGDMERPDMNDATTRRADGVRLALINNRLESIARKMANTLLRTGRSGVLNIARDFSCCIVTRDEQLLAAAESLPIHVLSGPDLMAAADEAVPSGAAPGRCVPAQLAVSRLLASGRPHHPGAGDRRCRRASFHRRRQGASGRLRQQPAHHLHGQRARRVRRRRADLPGRAGAARLPEHRRHHPHVPDAHPRARAMVGRLPRDDRRGAHR